MMLEFKEKLLPAK